MHQFAVSAEPKCRRAASSERDVLRPVDHYLWQAPTGTRFTVVAYQLVGCPAPLAASYLLVKRLDTGERKVVGFGRVTDAAASLNLATIRRHGAQLGANEVHLFALQGSPPASRDGGTEDDVSPRSPIRRVRAMAPVQ